MTPSLPPFPMRFALSLTLSCFVAAGCMLPQQGWNGNAVTRIHDLRVEPATRVPGTQTSLTVNLGAGLGTQALSFTWTRAVITLSNSTLLTASLSRDLNQAGGTSISSSTANFTGLRPGTGYSLAVTLYNGASVVATGTNASITLGSGSNTVSVSLMPTASPTPTPTPTPSPSPSPSPVGSTPGNNVSTVISGLDLPVGVAADPAGNVYWVVDFGTTIGKWSPSTGQTTFATGVSGTTDIIRTSDGSFYVCSTNGNLYKVPATGGSATVVKAGLGYLVALAKDSQDNVYIANSSGNSVVKVTPAGVSETYYSATGLDTNGVAVDSAGNVYASSRSGNKIWKILPNKTAIEWASGFTEPAGLTVDGNDNLYVIDFGANQVSKITPGGTKSFFAAAGGYIVRYDPFGNALYVADYAGGEITTIK